MNSEGLYNNLKSEFENKLHFLKDKPEENIDSTLKACWHFVAGKPLSAEEAVKIPLPSLNEKQGLLLHDILEQRVKNTPLAHITGRQNFFGIEFLSDKRALIPRKETELLAKKALELSNELTKQKEIIRVMDICCGSGNLGLAIAYYNKNTKIFASDLSIEAVALASDNTNFLKLQERVSIKNGDLFSPFESTDFYETISLIICNPPYISTAKVQKMDEEISAHEPSLAFDGGMFGLKIIQTVIETSPIYLEKNGWLIFEVGLGQGEFIMRLCERAEKYSKIESATDAAGNIRVIFAQKA